MKIVSITLAHSQMPVPGLIRGALASAPFADIHAVIDTTPDNPIVKQVLEGVDKVRCVDWKWRDDFSLARNLSLAIATAVVGEPAWGVILDTDERLHLDPSVDLRDALATHHAEADVLLVASKDGYQKDRFFRLPTQGAAFVGPTHEVCLGWKNRQTLAGMTFSELAKSPAELYVKRSRDERLLSEYTKKHPNDARWFYYLGDTLVGLERYDEAVVAFDRCASLRGWNEECAWASYRSAKISLDKGDYEKVIDACCRGMAHHAGLAELPWIAAVASSRLGRRDQATYWATISAAMGMNEGYGPKIPRMGFRHDPARWELPYDVLRYTTSGEEQAEAERKFYAAKEKRYGMPSSMASISRNVHDAVRHEARNDVALLARPIATILSTVRASKLLVDEAVLVAGGAAGYHLSNPSVAVHGGQLLCAIRSVNYKVEDDASYVVPASDCGEVKTQNFLSEIDPSTLTVRSIRHIGDYADAPKFPSLIHGYEDLRLIPLPGRLVASATMRDRAPNNRNAIALLELSDRGVERAYVQDGDRHEKNWMPILDGTADVSFLYMTDPTTVTRFDPETGQCKQVARHVPRFSLDHLRGGSQLIPMSDASLGFLAVTHEVTLRDKNRVYLHRFVRFAPDFTVAAVSEPWFFRRRGVEFCAGLARMGDDLILSYGLGDCEAWLMRVNETEVLAMLA
jgi:hypothetical protein